MASIILPHTDVYNKSVEKTQTRISQISNQTCLNVCAQNDSSNTYVIGAENVDINDIQRCTVSGASCILKSSLSSSITSRQSDIQKVKTAIASFQNTKVSNDNYQSISSDTSQYVNESCGNRSEQSRSGTNVYKNIKGGTINTGQLGFVGHSGCVLNNMSRAITNTDQENDQSVTQSGLGGIIGMILLILFIGVLIWLFAHMHRAHHLKHPAPTKSEGSVQETTNIVIQEKRSDGEPVFDQDKYTSHIGQFSTGVYVLLFFTLASFGTSLFFYLESYTAKKNCYSDVSPGAPRPTSANPVPGSDCATQSSSVGNPACYVPLLPDGSRAYNPFE